MTSYDDAGDMVFNLKPKFIQLYLPLPPTSMKRFIFGQLPKQLEPEITQILVKLWKFLSALICPSSTSSR